MALPTVPGEVDALNELAPHIRSGDVDPQRWEEAFAAYQAASFIGFEDNHGGIYHFMFWKKVSRCCPACGLIICAITWRSCNLTAHAQTAHYTESGAQINIALHY